ncbi:hypothetical protein A8B79_05940 [Balneola sp. EhC07]|uniref:hypothetical protein n=1 Tax=Balneola sp. EhC07 TaxID=1849360 RepID=UPI0007F53723|nr:hypothetical protein [Balneola sp. EhC07]OAN61014.1 hypothetical protein A8B79_05940 [Balneola sp. EhC07]
MSKLILDMDPRWEGYINEYTQEAFEKLSRDLTNTHDKVPKPVKRHLKRVESLLFLKSVNYELQDVAEFYCYTILEWSLRDLHRKTEGKNKQNLRPLLIWATEKKLVSLDTNKIEFICDCRNGFAHLNSEEDLQGILATDMIQFVVGLINEMYQ